MEITDRVDDLDVQIFLLHSVALTCQENGNFDKAKEFYHRILKIHPDFLPAYQGLATIRFPGENYISILNRFHSWLEPANYIEIGVESGRSLALAQPPTIAIGIDPDPRISYEFIAPTQIYAMTSDKFFETYDLSEKIGQSTVDLAFIDGQHLFEQTLNDLINLEKYASKESIFLIHDCLPLDKNTSTRSRSTTFWSGDTWKIIPCLKKFRPDLTIITVATPPTGLGIIINLDPTSTLLETHFNEITDEFMRLDYYNAELDIQEEMNVISNDWSSIRQQLESFRGSYSKQLHDISSEC